MCGTTGLRAQSQRDLDKRKTQLERQIKQTSQQLKATKSRKGAALQQAGQLKTQIAQREELIDLLQEESTRTVSQLYRDSTAVASLDEDLENILKEYTQIIRAANRARLTDSWMNFLFMADGINDLFRRTIYLRQYRNHRTKQARLIRRTKVQLDARLVALREERQMRDSLLVATVDQEAVLQQELSIQDGIVSTLSVEERKLLEKVRGQQAKAKQLQGKVAAAIRSNERKRSVPTKSSSRTTGTTATSNDARGEDIANRKGRLGWPVAGNIEQRFGRQPHPDVPSIMVDNRGVKIAGARQTKVLAIHAGKVVEVAPDGNGRTLVVVSHGGFYSIYANVEFPQVKAGASIDAGQQIALTAQDGSALQFELWRGKVALDPERWLR